MYSDSDLLIIVCIDGKEISVAKRKFMEQSFLLRCFIESTDSDKFDFPFSYQLASQFVSFVNSGDPQLTSIENAFQIYEISSYYQIEELEDRCQDFLIKNINPKTVCEIHDFAYTQKDRLIEYHCWTYFDSSWKQIFEEEDFLKCKETTILRFLTRPIYQTLTDLDLFLAVYKWIKYKDGEKSAEDPQTSKSVEYKSDSELYRHRMEPYLPFIKFLTISQATLEKHVFKLNILTEEEKEGIRFYHETNKTTKLPQNICNSTDRRTEKDKIYFSQFKYRNRETIPLNKNEKFKDSHQFISEITVYNDCFLTAVKLPITHSNNNGILVIFGGDIFYPKPAALNTQEITCTQNGYIELEENIYLERNASSRFYVTFLQYTEEDNILIKRGAFPYLIKKAFVKKRYYKHPYPKKQSNAFCFEVILYF